MRTRWTVILPLPALLLAALFVSCGGRKDRHDAEAKTPDKSAEKKSDAGDKNAPPPPKVAVSENMERMQREKRRIEQNLLKEDGLPVVIRASDEIGRLAKVLSEWPIDAKAFEAWRASQKAEDTPESRRSAQDEFVTACRDLKRCCEGLVESAGIAPVEWNRVRISSQSLHKSCDRCHAAFVAKP
jgi:hypothetical protein